MVLKEVAYSLFAFDIVIAHVLAIWMVYAHLTNTPEFKPVAGYVAGLWVLALLALFVACVTRDTQPKSTGRSSQRACQGIQVKQIPYQ